MAKKSVLNKDFNSLFDDNQLDESDSPQLIRLAEIEPNKNQPRKYFDLQALQVLADSIKENGVLQPLLVRPLLSGGYQIVAGERRWRASKMAGLTEVPVLIKELSEREAMQLALIENLQRENLNPIEEAKGYKDLIDSYGMSQDEVAKVVGKARSTVTNSLRLLTLPKLVRELLEKGEISAGHCKALMGISSPAEMTELALRAADGELSVRSIEKLAQRKAKTEPAEKARDKFLIEVEAALSEALNTTVKVSGSNKKKTVSIDFFSDESLTDFVNKLSE